MVSQQVVEVALLGGLALGGLFLLVRGLRELVLAYRLLATDPTPVADLPNVSGPVEVVGVAWIHDGTLEAPLTGRSCLAYDWEIEERRRDSDGDVTWRTIASGAESVPFLLEDDTGSVLVDPRSAELRLERTRESVRVGSRERGPDSVRRFVDGIGHDVDISIGSFDLSVSSPARRYTESRLDPDESAYVYGTPTYAPGEGRRAGQVNARIEDGRPFVVADGTESEATRRVLGGAALFVTLGVLLLGAAVWALLFR